MAAPLLQALSIVFPILILFGQLARIDIFGYNFPVIDIFLPILAFASFVHSNKQTKPNKFFIIFTIITVISFLINAYSYSSIKPFLFLIRLLSFTILLNFPPKFINSKFLSLAIISNILFGLIQYLIWPDFTYFSSQNWDPHLYRLVSTYFDPTFTALIYLFFLIYLFQFSFSGKIPLLILVYLALALTYSRSALLSFFIAFLFIFIKTKKYVQILFLVIITSATIFLLPRMPGEGTKLERTSSIKAKIENYQEGISLYVKNPLIGIGYNNISSYRQTNNVLSHDKNGFDGSLLTILITTGVFGLIAFILGLKQHFTLLNTPSQAMFIAFFIHSLFANSLLYPFAFIVYLLLIRYRK